MRRWLIGAACLALMGLGLDRLDRALPPDLSRLTVSGTEFTARDGRTLALLPAPGGVWRFRTEVEDVAPVLLETLVATEDRRFWWHFGVNRAPRGG